MTATQTIHKYIYKKKCLNFAKKYINTYISFVLIKNVQFKEK